MSLSDLGGQHCRKCGGVFCASCTSRSTPLLDTSKLDFLHPPRNVPLSTYASPISPIEPCRVCDRCYDQIHGITSIPRIPDLIRPSLTRLLSSPISMLRSPLSSSPTTSGPSSLASSVGMSAHPLAASESAATSLLDTAAPLSRRPSKTRSLRTQSSIASLNGTRRSIIRASHLALPSELNKSYGELDAYPLRRSSILCKATGGGRWEPKQEPELIGYRPPVPGAKAQYELEIERLERDERKRLESPIVRDGEFQYRFPRKTCPVVIACSPSPMSTF
ncbi:hypothetical protein DXG03_001988 [Asterophora parasitica]|uniref:FYVE-type domain-containing protein n=1 Tax=Asterophora parasitica TaxID=117018 RepID=A0A9P7GGY2_9AGAR|nr:hypothetical protein DXG03_001988 [Asterophora parasitica]